MRSNPLRVGLALLAAASPVLAQTVDIDQLERELLQIFERPQGTPISDAQKKRLGEFVDEHREHLGRLGYAAGLHSYLTRDYDRAAAQLDAFFENHDSIAVDEHRLMVGRTYMGAFARLASSSSPDPEQLGRYGERATRLYADMDLLARYMPQALGRIPDESTARVARLALVRGALAADAAPEAVDGFVRSLYGAPVAADAAAPRRATRPQNAADETQRTRDALTGKEAPALSPEAVVFGDRRELPPTAGKVVLVDFWATWCGPCRRVIPHLVELQAKHGDELQIIGATRFYGYGADFSGEGAAPPHTGATTVRDLDREGEIDINRTFADVFELNYPIAFVDKTVFGAYGIKGIPTLFVIGRDGKVVGHVVGAGDTSAVDELVERALAR